MHSGLLAVKGSVKRNVPAAKAGFAGTRPYALRHTFATTNLARGENIKTVSVLLGRAGMFCTRDLYVGFIPAITRGIANRYAGGPVPTLMEDANDDKAENELKEDFRRETVSMRYTVIR